MRKEIVWSAISGKIKRTGCIEWNSIRKIQENSLLIMLENWGDECLLRGWSYAIEWNIYLILNFDQKEPIFM